jgi:glycosyltransferase involved in cell wall biosynthesis
MGSPAVTPDVSVVIPVYNEADNVEELCRQLADALDRSSYSYEIIFVDDGSTDRTFELLQAQHKRDPRIGVIQFRRNFGQTAAFAAGFAAARGNVIVTSDGDLQNDPKDIPGMVARLGDGFDIVCGWRKDRKDAWLNRRLPSLLANRLISWATGVRLNDYGCSLKAFRAEVVKPLRLYGEMHRFLPALASEVGVRIDEQPVNHRARVHGRSKYGIGRTIRVILDLLTVKFLLSYSTRPLQMFGLIGIVLGALGIAVLAYLAGVKYIGHEAIGNRPLLMLGILLIFIGVQLVTSGLLAELIARTYHESQDKPIFVIRKVLSAADAPPLRDTRSTAAR